MRSPRRTAQTASALMVGLALVSAIAVFGASLSSSATGSVDQAISADIIVSTPQQRAGRLQQRRGADRGGRPRGSRRRRRSTRTSSRCRATSQSLTAVSTRDLSETVILNMTEGSSAALAAGDLLIDTTTANSKHLSAGDIVPVKFAKTGSRPCGSAASSRRTRSSAATWSVTGSSWPLRQPAADRRAVEDRRQPGVEQSVTHALAGYPNVKMQTRAQFEQSQAGPGEPAARPRLRAARPGRAHRPDRHREHADALGLRADARDRAAARGRHETPPDPGHDPLRVGDPGRLRRGHRHRRRDGPGHRAGLVAQSQGITDIVVPVSSLVVFLSSPRSWVCSPPAGPPAARPGWTCWRPSPPSDAVADAQSDAWHRPRSCPGPDDLEVVSGHPLATTATPSSRPSGSRAIRSRSGRSATWRRNATGCPRSVAPLRRAPARRDGGRGDLGGRPGGPAARRRDRRAAPGAHDYKVIFFRDQPLTPPQHVAFARRFGDLEIHPFLPSNTGEPELVRFEKSAEVSGYENSWHHDVTWRAAPPWGRSSMRCRCPTPAATRCSPTCTRPTRAWTTRRRPGSTTSWRSTTSRRRSGTRCRRTSAPPRSSTRRCATRSCARTPARGARTST